MRCINRKKIFFFRKLHGQGFQHYIILTLLAMVMARWTASASSCTWKIPMVSEKTQMSPVKPNDEQTLSSLNNP